MTSTTLQRVALVTGSARRIGAALVRYFHSKDYNVLIHYRQSEDNAKQLAAELNNLRNDSAKLVQGDLEQLDCFSKIVKTVENCWGRLDVLINNASSFFPTEVGTTTEKQWDDLFASNLKGPYFLSQALVPLLQQSTGCIINIADIHGLKPLKDYPVYSMAKAGLIMMTQALAKELGPAVRVNAVAPGPVCWPEGENQLDNTVKQQIQDKTILPMEQGLDAVIQAAYFFAEQAHYTTGQVLPVDGGRVLYS